MKGTFCITGAKVQGVGYRPFLLGKFEDYNLSGRARNLPSGKDVEVTVWGEKRNIKALYRHLQSKNAKPKKAIVAGIAELKLEENSGAHNYEVLRHGQAVMAGQFYRAVEVQTAVAEKLGVMDNKLGKLGKLGKLDNMDKKLGALAGTQAEASRKISYLDANIGKRFNALGKKIDTLISVVRARGI